MFIFAGIFANVRNAETVRLTYIGVDLDESGV
ncbi:hypothetical protein AAZX31_04G167600 [Glycine max]